MSEAVVTAPPQTATGAALVTRLSSLDAARGLAALAVALFHFTGSPAMQAVPWLHALGQVSWAGVEAFFVISGFIVPASFAAFGTRIQDSMRFMVRRLLRLYLPFLAALILAVLLNVGSSLAPGYRGPGLVLPTLSELLCNLSYACEFSGHAWIIPVFWSLAIEIQFYLLLMLMVPMLGMRLGARTIGPAMIGVTLALLLVLAPYSPKVLVLHDLPLFSCGFFAWLWHAGKLRALYGLLLMIGSLLLVAYTHGSIAAIAAAMTVLIAHFLQRPWPVLIWLGTVSYSLYLIHIPIGGRVINLSLRVAESPPALSAAVLAATAICLFAAHVCWRFIEAPAQAYSRRVLRAQAGQP
ncbi:hypothetical protein C7S18_23115 [Ahniella affigens]|uniref:Acyltransferase 3 domain-containing protein n=1 Tax=Ahniella affigens TaxID=2021234 RepID=A0A2P1PYI5_9GAMM|nr:acyltransferase [Ahniella affigens]AVP99890.1 hypothetical protein C7S18_23115 [Ahniella affigens]